MTAVVGWDNPASQLYIELKTPAGTSITGGAGTETHTGNTWTFIRLQLPYTGERDGYLAGNCTSLRWWRRVSTTTI
ncbi:MAG: hypothetical protein WKF91_10920 [Segetibacter sp.]